MIVPRPSFAHLLAMADDVGLFEHADGTVPRRHHGYCTDDVARLLVVVVREPHPRPEVVALGDLALRFLLAAQGEDGAVHNRRAAGGRWEDRRNVEDCWGRSLWAFGTATGRALDPARHDRAWAAFGRGVERRSPWPRAMAFAALGAAEVLAVHPGHGPALDVLTDTITSIGPLGTDPRWPWPEARLTYANAVLAEALLVAGDALGRPAVVCQGLTMLRWLVAREVHAGHCSPTPVGGAGPDDRAPAFDQQPIEVAAMADACLRAAAVTGDGGWLLEVERTVRWFLGDNDSSVPLWDPSSGGGYDGLMVHGANQNQGAESTLALVATLQHGRTLAAAVAGATV